MAMILIVEDYLVAQRVLTRRLRNSGHNVIVADNGCQALQQLCHTTVDLIISDIAMPEMDGLKLLRCVRDDVRYRHLPFVILTASVLDYQRQEAQAAGVNGFLEKPVSSLELDEVIHQLLKSQDSSIVGNLRVDPIQTT